MNLMGKIFTHITFGDMVKKNVSKEKEEVVMRIEIRSEC